MQSRARIRVILSGIFLCLLDKSNARRCFECKHVAKPDDCGNITECNSDENCFSEQFVTLSGNIVYNSGCRLISLCSKQSFPLIGKRLLHTMDKRVTDIPICLECCSEEFCNRKGCGVQEVPLGQRGPYCFNCHAMMDPSLCMSVFLCDQDEMCIIYEEKSGSFQYTNVTFRSRCASASTCDSVSQPISSHECSPSCCKTDFCNNQCLTTQPASTTTGRVHTDNHQAITTGRVQTDNHQAITTEHSTIISTNSVFGSRTTLKTETVTQGTSVSQASHSSMTTHATFHCHRHGGYIRLHKRTAHLCIHIVNDHATWDEAREACKQEGGDLVVLDSYDKALLLRNELNAHANHSNYWIGARDFKQNNHFAWVNNQSVDELEADWGLHQPDNFGLVEDCVGMTRFGTQHDYKWNDMNCDQRHISYICERL